MGGTCWIAALNYRADVPKALQAPLMYLGIALGVLAVLYLLFSILSAAHRRAYNLTKAETAQPGKSPGPAFLTVDHEARAAAIRRGDEYVRPETPAPVEAAAAVPAPRREPWSVGRMACRFGAVSVGAGHVLLLLVALFKTSTEASSVWGRITTWERASAVITRYWFGFALVGIVVVAELARSMLRKKAAK